MPLPRVGLDLRQRSSVAAEGAARPSAGGGVDAHVDRHRPSSEQIDAVERCRPPVRHDEGGRRSSACFPHPLRVSRHRRQAIPLGPLDVGTASDADDLTTRQACAQSAVVDGLAVVLAAAEHGGQRRSVDPHASRLRAHVRRASPCRSHRWMEAPGHARGEEARARQFPASALSSGAALAGNCSARERGSSGAGHGEGARRGRDARVRRRGSRSAGGSPCPTRSAGGRGGPGRPRASCAAARCTAAGSRCRRPARCPRCL